jgi:hypothetical protein
VSAEERYKKALAAISEEVNKIIAWDETPPAVQCVLDTIAAICEHGADVRTEADKEWQPEDVYDVDETNAFDDTEDNTDKPAA